MRLHSLPGADLCARSIRFSALDSVWFSNGAEDSRQCGASSISGCARWRRIRESGSKYPSRINIKRPLMTVLETAMENWWTQAGTIDAETGFDSRVSPEAVQAG
ncbi:hypothetical protein GCM10010207_78950 [Streptomyces atratus]|nr:hypothetical protein GCM10010207_78950 [Streptomyces atratus]